MIQEDLKKYILSEYEKGNIVVYNQEGLMTAKISEIVKQPIEGLLYDVNRDYCTIMTFINDPKWINDFALSKIVEELKNQLDEANKTILSLKNQPQ